LLAQQLLGQRTSPSNDLLALHQNVNDVCYNRLAPAIAGAFQL